MSRPQRPSQPRHDAIHRALLAGLLSRVGCKGQNFEYQGPRGIRFAIFPGSGQFQRRPEWVMAGELVQTTRLYARTVAGVRPEWIERAAEHLLKRTHFDPHWNGQTGHVVAYEKVSLYGLILVPQRPVHYGPIDPVKAREIFIQHALVEGDCPGEAPFLRHNQRLVEEVQRLEAKRRQRDLLVRDQARFDFYAARIPAGVYSWPLLERWRRQVERHNPRVLFMSRRDLMLHAAAEVTQEQFPDLLLIDGLRIGLEYHLEPGHPADGVTAVIPLAALPQIPAERFEWLVPGLLPEKLTALIKSLPKELRVNFVPAPEFAAAAAGELKPGDGGLRPALAAFLSRRRGINVPPEAFDPGTLLDHLLCNFRIVDEAGRAVATGRDLDALRRQLGVKVAQTLASTPHPRYHRDGVTAWDFGDLPPFVEVRRHGMTVRGYPALVDLGAAGVGLRLLESPRAADAAHVAGLRKLLIQDLREEIRYVASVLPDMPALELQYRTLGSAEQLRREIMMRAVSRAFQIDAQVRTAMEYELRKEAGRRHRLLEEGRAAARLAAEILAAYQPLAVQLERRVIAAWEPAIADVRGQLAHLLPPGFLTQTPEDRLAHLPRYLKGMHLRLTKLATVGHTRDAQRMAEVQPWWQSYLERIARRREGEALDPALVEFRWMIEEFRISLFAQELRAAIPISAKRLEQQWQKVRG
jgi:ATP-dependent helicase HrpA